MIAPDAGLSVSRQCTLLGIARSSFYYQPRPTSAEELDLLNRLDRIFTGHPVYGSRRLQVALLREGISVGRRRIRRLMRKLGLSAVRPKRNTSKPHPEHKIYPYLLRDKTIDQPNQVWASDITYIPMRRGFLVVVRNGASRAEHRRGHHGQADGQPHAQPASMCQSVLPQRIEQQEDGDDLDALPPPATGPPSAAGRAAAPPTCR